MKKLFLMLACPLFLFACGEDKPTSEPTPDSIVAFPNAEGGGAYTEGGRGGLVATVTRLDDSKTQILTGSLRWALSQPGKKIIVFKVAGIIELAGDLKIPSNVTVLGQSAPGDGICVKNYPVLIEGDNVVIRFVRFRMGDEKITDPDAGDALTCKGRKNILIDHCSFSWSTDECVSCYNNENFTMQYCIISESMNYSKHSKGRHGYGGIWGGNNVTFHHNLLAHHYDRNPRFDHDCVSARRGPTDFANNVIYNWGRRSSYGGENRQLNIINNYYQAGPASSNKDKILDPAPSTGLSPFCGLETNTAGKYYIAGNYADGYSATTSDNWTYGVSRISESDKTKFKTATPFTITPSISYESPEKAKENVLNFAGASLVRDAVDVRIIDNVRTGSFTPKTMQVETFDGEHSTNGLIDSQKEVGGYPVYTVSNIPTDTDLDGIPDDWEIAKGLNPNSAADGKAKTLDPNSNYTNLEVYLNDIVKHLYP